MFSINSKTMILTLLISLQFLAYFILFLGHTGLSIKHIKIIHSYQVILAILLYISLVSALVHFFILQKSFDEEETSSSSVLLFFLKFAYLVLDTSKEFLLKFILFYMCLGWQILYLWHQLRFIHKYIVAYMVVFCLMQLLYELWPSGAVFTFLRDSLDCAAILWMNLLLNRTNQLIVRLKKSPAIRKLYQKLGHVMLFYLALKCVEIFASLLWRIILPSGEEKGASTTLLWEFTNAATRMEFFRSLTEIPVTIVLACLTLLWVPQRENVLLNFTQDLHLDVLDNVDDQFELFDADEEDDELFDMNDDDEDQLDLGIDTSVQQRQTNKDQKDDLLLMDEPVDEPIDR